MNLLLYFYHLLSKNTLPVKESNYLLRELIFILYIAFILWWNGIDPVILQELYPLLSPQESLSPELLEIIQEMKQSKK